MISYGSRQIWLTTGFIVAAALVLTSSYKAPVTAFHTPEELKALRESRSPIQDGEYFLGSGNCRGCHGYDTLQVANIDANGNDINLFDDWESSMMAFSAKDPLWRAKVNHEILVNPALADELQNKCTSCHAPMGHFSAMFKGASLYTLNDVLNDTLGLNGVACTACHFIAKDSIGSAGVEYSGALHYDTSRHAYGPFETPLTGPMELYVGLTPTHSLHMSRSAVCAPCHTLLTKTVDLNGNLTGAYSVEQATYHEWLNSAFNSDQPCQSCHMPQIQDPVIIANNILNLPPRSPFNLHKFMGGNSFMLKLIKQNKSGLDINVPDGNIDSTISATMDLLQHSTLDMVSQIDSVTNDTLFVSVQLTNKAGHKFPSGYPSRRAYVQFAVTAGADTVFQSGILRPDYEITGQSSNVEPHYDVITDSTQVQIYEMVMGDVNGNFTTVLARAAEHIKDNRLPPSGFKTTHYAYDTTRIVGVPAADADFNHGTFGEGSGSDIVHYHIPLRGKGGQLHIASAVYYQVLPPRWLTEMFTHNGQFIDSFKTMYQQADKAPVLIANSQLDTTVEIISSVKNIGNSADWVVYPTPTVNGNVVIQNNSNLSVNRIEIWDAAGRKTADIPYTGNRGPVSVTLPQAAGIYYLRIYSGKQIAVKKVVVQ